MNIFLIMFLWSQYFSDTDGKSMLCSIIINTTFKSTVILQSKTTITLLVLLPVVYMNDTTFDYGIT